MNSTTLKKLLSLLTAFAMVFGMIALVRPMQANAATVEIPISNGDFENGAFGGAVNGSNGAAIIAKATYEGNYALKFDATGEILTVTGYLAQATTAESTVTLSFWAKVLGGSTGNSVNFGLFATNESWGNRVQKYGAGYPIVGGDWKQISQALTVPAGTKILQAQIYLGSEGTTAIVDNVSMTDGNGNEILQSGGFENGALNGDFNANDALEIVCTPVHGGSYAAHADKSAGNGNISTTISIEPSSEARTMQFSYWMYAPTSANGAHNMVVCFDTSSGSWTNLSTKYGAQYAAPGVWVQKTMEIAVAPNTNTLQIQLYAQDNGADFYIDDLKLTEEVADVAVNHDVTLSLNQVTGDGTWQFSISEAPANKYYKASAIIDGVACEFLMGESGGIMCVYPNFFTAIGGAVPTQQIVMEAGTVLKAVDPNGWKEIEGADTLTIAETIDLSCVNGTWGKTVYTTDVTLSLNQVTGDGTWQFSISEAPADKYYKVPAIIDGVESNFLMGESGGIMCVYPNFFTAIGGAVPTQQIVIEAGTVLKAVDPNGGWAEIEGASTLTVAEKIDLSYVNGAWSKTVYTTDVTLSLNQVTGDGTWQLGVTGEAIPNGYYKIPVSVDGNACNVLAQYNGEILIIYPNFFPALGGAVPTESFVIEEGAILKAVDSTNGWQEIEDAIALAVPDGLNLVNHQGNWMDPSQIVETTYTELKASDLRVYRAEDQSADQYRSTFAISSAVAIDNAGWANFTAVDAKVLVNGNETSAIFGMVPASDSSWANESAFLLYITGEGYWDAASTADSITICAGTKIVSPLDNTKGFEFTEDFVMYRNEDGSWDTTEDPTIEKQEISIGLNQVTGDGTWQLGVTGEAIPNGYYKIPVSVDGNACNVLAQYNGEILIIYPNFFPALGGAVPAQSLEIAKGAMLKTVDSNDGWKELEATPVCVTSELKIENIAGKWVEMSKYADVSFTEIYGVDLDLYYQNIMRLGDYSDAEVNLALSMYPQYKPLYETYGRQANMTTFGIVPNIPTLQIPNDASWATFTLLGTISVQGATPAETYVMQTPDSSDDAETAMTNGFLIRFYNGFIADNATSVTIEPGTRIVTKDGKTGFVFVDGYTIYRDENGNWTDTVPAGVNPVNKWGLTLGDNIGVNFEMNVNAGDEVTFTVNGKAVTAQQSGNTYTIALTAAQMTDAIAISVNGAAIEKTYSVRAYADIILAGNYGDTIKNLVRNMLVYGGAAQTYFGHNTGSLASAGIEVTAAVPTGAAEFTVNDGLAGIELYGATLVLRDRIAVRYYFNATSVEDLTITANGVDCQIHKKGDRYYVEVADINPQDLENQITVVVSNGTDSLTASYSPLNYVVRMYEKAESSATLKALVQALYGYHLAAEAYTA